MAKSNELESMITPEQCFADLPEIKLDISRKDADDGLRRAELRRSLLAIAEINHVRETEIVQAVVRNTLGKIPDIEE